MERASKTVDLGGGWQAVIVRPQPWISTRWSRTLRGGLEPHQVAAEVASKEQGRDDPPPPPPSIVMTSENLAVWESEVYPHVVKEFITPDGEHVSREEVWLADLGLNSFYILLGAVHAFVSEADASFRGQAGGL